VFLGGKVPHYTSFFWSDAYYLILESPLGVFPDRAFFILWPSGLKTQFIDAWLALPDGHLTIWRLRRHRESRY